MLKISTHAGVYNGPPVHASVFFLVNNNKHRNASIVPMLVCLFCQCWLSAGFQIDLGADAYA